MTEVYIYIINGTITTEDKNRNVLHRMTGFTDSDKVKMIVEALTNMYVVLEVYDWTITLNKMSILL